MERRAGGRQRPEARCGKVLGTSFEARTPLLRGRMSALTRAADTLVSHWLLCVLVLAGAVLRAGAVLADRPAVMLFGDSFGFFGAARTLRPDLFHPLVYSIFLRILWRTGNVTYIVVVQHLLAILLSIAIYATLRRLGVRRWLAALGVAPLLLDAYQIFLEQNILSETIFEVLVAASLIVIVWSPRDRLRWATGIVVGLSIGLAILTRGVGLAVLPAACVVLLVTRRGWRQPAAILLTCLVLLAGYSAWNYRVNGQFTIDQMSGRWLYGRVSMVGNCHDVHGIPPDERVLCDTSFGADPKGYVAEADGVGFYVWDPKSPWYRLRPGPHQSRYQMAQDYAIRVILGDPVPYLWSVVRDTAQFFAPTREQVMAGGVPLASESFQPVTHPRQNHVLIAVDSSMLGAITLHHGLPGRQQAQWPIGLLDRYQSFGYTPGPVLAACLVLVLIAAAWGSRNARGRSQREAAVLFGLTGLLLLVVPAATVGDDVRYLLPTLSVIPPAGALATESLIGPARVGVNRLLDRSWRRREPRLE